MTPTTTLLEHIATEPKGREWLTTLRELAAKVSVPKQPKLHDLRFETLWADWDKYGSKAKAYAYWQKLTAQQRDEVLDKAPDYIASTPGCLYRKQLEGWLNPTNRLWERPIPKPLPAHGQPTTEDQYTAKRIAVAEANAKHYRERDAIAGGWT